MKRIIILAAAVLAAVSASAQDAQKAAEEAAKAYSEAKEEVSPAEKPSFWTKSVLFKLGFNQTSLTNWAAGGYNTITLATGIDARATYAKELLSWDNRIQLDYAFFYSAEKTGLLQKSNDRIYLESKAAYKTGKSKWNYTASLDFRSQFTDTPSGYEQDSEGKWKTSGLKSGFLSPGYLNLAFGMEWKPVDWFNINIAPLTGGMVVTTNKVLRPNYGMPLAENGVDYLPALFQFGAQIKTNAKVSLNDKFIFETQAVVFTDYLNKPFVYNRVNWDNKLTWIVSKFFNIGVSTWLIYDPIVVIDGVMSKVQFKEFASLSFTYTFIPKKKLK